MSKRQRGLTELKRLADDLCDEEGDDQCDFDSDDSSILIFPSRKEHLDHKGKMNHRRMKMTKKPKIFKRFYMNWLWMELYKKKTIRIVNTKFLTQTSFGVNMLGTAKLKRAEITSREDQNGIVILKSKGTSDVRLLSTKHPPRMIPVKNVDNPPLASTFSAASTSRTESPEPLPDSQDSDQEAPSIIHDDNSSNP
ncbi:hypothetical protein HHI36_014661 [Cryptolaemus montrouzieri]|uniref:Uncharacterized protein n=1 Tax=Cryptolaemus montrouzieri TaxID=559131 RepID=A0ABD2N3E7_9CUCU